MSNTPIPADAVRILRSALMTELGDPVAKLDEATMAANREKNPDWFLVPLAEVDEIRTVLGAIGWEEPERQEPVALDLERHRAVIVKALRVQLEVEHAYMQPEEHADDPEAERTREIASRNAAIIEGLLHAHALTGCE